jgi:hypothetical protein
VTWVGNFEAIVPRYWPEVVNARFAAPGAIVWISTSTTPSSRAAAQVRTNAMLYQQHVTRADQGCDFAFLQTGAAMPVADPDIFWRSPVRAASALFQTLNNAFWCGLAR